MPRDRRRRTRGLGLALSAALHVAVLAGLGWELAPRLSPPSAIPPPAVELTLVRPLPAPASATSRSAQASATAGGAPALARPPMRPPSAIAPPPPQAAAPLAPAPAAAPAAPAAGAGAGVHPGPMPGAESGGDFKGFLRAGVGCAHRDGVGLTRAERELCDQKAGEVAKGAPTIDKIAPEKRAYYDTVVAAYAKMHAPAPAIVLHNGDNLGVQERWAGEPGSHMPGFGCKAPMGKPRGWKSYHDKPPHSLKLGPLPCLITPPSGYMTEEADVQTPASLREREDDAKHMRDLDPPKAAGGAVSPPGT